MHDHCRSNWLCRRAVAKAAAAMPVIALTVAVLITGCGTTGAPHADGPPRDTVQPRETVQPRTTGAARTTVQPAATGTARGTGAPGASAQPGLPQATRSA